MRSRNELCTNLFSWNNNWRNVSNTCLFYNQGLQGKQEAGGHKMTYRRIMCEITTELDKTELERYLKENKSIVSAEIKTVWDKVYPKD